MKERNKWLHSPVLPKGFTISPTLHQQSFDQLGEQQKSVSGGHRTGSSYSYTELGIFLVLFFFSFFFQVFDCLAVSF